MAPRGRRPGRPAATPQERESQLTSLAYDLAERRLVDGSATAQEVVFFLKAGSQREQLEQQKLLQENMVLAARAEQMAQNNRLEQLMGEALNAFRSYSGGDEDYDLYGGDPDGY